jgi:L-rhamnose-H+ transport protein
MDSAQILGFGLMLLGAICGGSFGLPSKFARKDTPWEVLWGPFFFIATIVIPCVVAPLVVEDLGGIYSRVGFQKLLPVLIFGFLWGLGSMTLGMSFSFIGLSLAYALNYGAQIMFGSMLPMAIFDAHQILTPHGCVILAGVAVCLVGVVVSGRAGILKDRSTQKDEAAEQSESAPGKQPRMLIGLIIGVLSGVLCACYAVASAYAGPIGNEAAKTTPDWAAAWAVTAMILWGGAVSSCLYCAVQLTKNRTWGQLVGPGAGLVFLLAAAMAVLHDAAIFFFGLGWINLGKLGVPVGYPVFMSFAIIVGNIHGFRTGEWKGASRQSVTWIVAGIILLIIGVCILAGGKTMMAG